MRTTSGGAPSAIFWPATSTMSRVENFMTAAGYRNQRNAANIEIGTFQPTRPFAGAPGSGLRIQRNGAPMPPPMPMEEKKAPKEEQP